MLENNDIDAVIVATPDHWHSKIVVDAVNAGKHVYVEKGLTRTFQEALDIHDAVKETGMILQLGHQNRQVEANDKAKQIEILMEGVQGAAMQSYAEQLSEGDIAAVISYTRKAWGNDASGDGEIVIPKEILDYKNNKL